jgi:hypothetical protein
VAEGSGYRVLFCDRAGRRAGRREVARPVRDQRLLSTKATSCDLDSAPTLVASTSPFLNSSSVGMPRIPNCGGVRLFWSMFSFATLSRPWYSPAI